MKVARGERGSALPLDHSSRSLKARRADRSVVTACLSPVPGCLSFFLVSSGGVLRCASHLPLATFTPRLWRVFGQSPVTKF
jgi:hypothetical protein